MSHKTPVSPSSGTAIAVCARPLSVGSVEMQLLPSGKFRATEGRPKDAPHWYVDATVAEAS